MAAACLFMRCSSLFFIASVLIARWLIAPMAGDAHPRFVTAFAVAEGYGGTSSCDVSLVWLWQNVSFVLPLF